MKLAIIIFIGLLTLVIITSQMKVKAWNTVTVTPSSCATSTPKPTDTPRATPLCGNDIWCESPSPTETPVPTEMPVPSSTPTVSATPAPTNPPSTSGGGGGGQSNSAPTVVCTAPSDAPKLQGFKEGTNGDVTFSWWPSTSTNVDSQSIVYGCAPDKLIYGVNGIDKNATSFTINGLKCPGMRWAKVLANSNGCAVGSNVFDP